MDCEPTCLYFILGPFDFNCGMHVYSAYFKGNLQIGVAAERPAFHVFAFEFVQVFFFSEL